MGDVLAKEEEERLALDGIGMASNLIYTFQSQFPSRISLLNVLVELT